MVGRDDDSFGAALHVRVISARDIKVRAPSSFHPSRIWPHRPPLPSPVPLFVSAPPSLRFFPLPVRPQVSRVRIARLFATVEACGARFRSTGRVSTSSPVWDEAGVVPLTRDWRDGCARVIIWDRTLTSRPVRLGRCDVPLDRIGINDGMGEMDLSLVIRGAKGGGVHARGTVRVAMEVRTATDGGQDDETTSEECVEDGVEHETSEHVNTISGANIDADAHTPSMENATAEGEVAGDGAATEPEPCTPANQPTASTTQSMISPVAASLAQSTASLRAYVLASGKLADAVESTPTFSAVRGGRRGWSARTPPRHPNTSDADNRQSIPLSPVPVTETPRRGLGDGDGTRGCPEDVLA